MASKFESLGFFIEFLVDGKLIGTKNVKENPHPKKEVGYYSKQVKVADSDIIFKNKRIKKGSTYYTRVYPLNGKTIQND